MANWGAQNLQGAFNALNNTLGGVQQDNQYNALLQYKMQKAAQDRAIEQQRLQQEQMMKNRDFALNALDTQSKISERDRKYQTEQNAIQQNQAFNAGMQELNPSSPMYSGQNAANYMEDARFVAGFNPKGMGPGLDAALSGLQPDARELLVSGRAGSPAQASRMVDEGKTTRAKAGAANVSVDTGAKSMTELAKQMSGSLVEQGKEVEQLVSTWDTIKNAKDLLDAGMITGTGAEFLTNMGNFLSSRMGITFAEDPVANSQAYSAMMGRQVGQIIKQFGSGTGLSDADREYAEKIVAGKITLNEKALRRLIDINEKAMKRVHRVYSKKAERAMQMPGAESLPYDLRVAAPWEEKGPDLKEGQTATNPGTGKQIIFKGGKWRPM